MLQQEEEVQTLRELGLTLLQAKVYLALTKTGNSTVKRIAEKTEIARQEAQRVITELLNAGLVEKILASPIVYKPVSIDDTLNFLLERRQKESSDLAQKVNLLLKNLAHNQVEEYKVEKTVQFIIINGKENILRRHRRIIRSAAETGDIIHGSGATARYSFCMFEEEANEALKRNVKFRIITSELPSYQSPESISKYLDRGNPNFEVRFTPLSLPLTISIFDKKELIVYTAPEKNVGDAPILWTDSQGLILVAQNYFDQFWQKTKRLPLSKKIIL